MNRTREQVYEYLRHLDYTSIKNLCQSDRYYRDLCHSDMFQTLIREKYRETTEYEVRQLEQKTKKLQGDEILDFHFHDNIEHYMEIYPNVIIEDMPLTRFEDYKKLWLFKLLDKETGFSRLSQQELLDYAETLDREGRGTIGKYMGVINVGAVQEGVISDHLINSWIEDHNLNYKVLMYGGGYIKMQLIKPTSKQLRELLTMILESEPKPEIYEDTKDSAMHKYGRYI